MASARLLFGQGLRGGRRSPFVLAEVYKGLYLRGLDQLWAALLLGTLGADVAVLGVATSTPQFTKSHSSGGVVMATLAAEAAMDSMAL